MNISRNPRVSKNVFFNKAKAYFQKHGHLCVPKSFDTKLYHWLAAQRHRFNKGLLDDHTTAMLSAIGMDWNPTVPTYWLGQFGRLQRYLLKHKKEPTPMSTNPLGAWLDRQKKKYLKGRLSARQIEMLATVTRLPADRATERLRRLANHVLDYVQDGKHIDSSSPVYDDYLFVRNAFKTGRLPRELVTALQSAKIDLTIRSCQKGWNYWYQQLYDWTASHGTLPSYVVAPALYRWLERPQKANAKGILLPARARKLSALHKKYPYTNRQAGALREVLAIQQLLAAGSTLAEACGKYGITTATFRNRKARFSK
jgi:hypothetical protein